MTAQNIHARRSTYKWGKHNHLGLNGKHTTFKPKSQHILEKRKPFESEWQTQNIQVQYSKHNMTEAETIQNGKHQTLQVDGF